MAPIETKKKSAPTNDSFVRSKRPADAFDRPSKRLRSETVERLTATPKIHHVPKISRVREEDEAFPRGGASILTPLEHKQIHIEATRDVLFEQQNSKSSQPGASGGDDEKRASKRGSKSKKKEKGGIDIFPEENESVKVEGLSYKVCAILFLMNRKANLCSAWSLALWFLAKSLK
jgi:rRNA biogenesis protein RRP5